MKQGLINQNLDCSIRFQLRSNEKANSIYMRYVATQALIIPRPFGSLSLSKTLD